MTGVVPLSLTVTSADQKPLVKADGTALPVGALLTERDTGAVYRWDGTAWGLTAGGGAGVTAGDYLLAARLDETNRLLRKLILGLELNFANGEFPDAE